VVRRVGLSPHGTPRAAAVLTLSCPTSRSPFGHRIGTAALVVAAVQVGAGWLAHFCPDWTGGRATASKLLALHRVAGYYTHALLFATVLVGLSTGWFARLRPELWEYAAAAAATVALAAGLFVRQDLGTTRRALAVLLGR